MAKMRLLAMAGVIGLMFGCSYGGVAAVDGDTVVIAKSNGFLFGLLNKVYVCQVSDSGLTGCASNESP